MNVAPEPLRGVKVAGLILTGNDILFSPVSGPALLYGAEAAAACDPTRCAAPVGHGVPTMGSSCGFHAMRRPDPGELIEYWAVCDVELWGTVVEHVAGWRSSHQRVLAAQVPGRCAVCFTGVTERLAVLSGGRLMATCASCAALMVERDPVSGALSLADATGLARTEIRRADPYVSARQLGIASRRIDAWVKNLIELASAGLLDVANEEELGCVMGTFDASWLDRRRVERRLTH